MTYCSEADIKNSSQVTYADLGYANDAAFCAFLDDLTALADSLIDSYCRVPAGFFEAGGVAISNELLDFGYPWTVMGYNPMFFPWISLWYHPVISISKVEYNTAGYGQAANFVTIVEPDYIPKLPEGMIMLVNKIPALAQNSVRVSYTAGYAATPVAVRQVAIQLCANALHVALQRKLSPVVKTSEWAVQLVGSDIFTKDMQLILAPFVRRLVGVG